MLHTDMLPYVVKRNHWTFQIATVKDSGIAKEAEPYILIPSREMISKKKGHKLSYSIRSLNLVQKSNPWRILSGRRECATNSLDWKSISRESTKALKFSLATFALSGSSPTQKSYHCVVAKVSKAHANNARTSTEIISREKAQNGQKFFSLATIGF